MNTEIFRALISIEAILDILERLRVAGDQIDDAVEALWGIALLTPWKSDDEAFQNLELKLEEWGLDIDQPDKPESLPVAISNLWRAISDADSTGQLEPEP